MSHFKCDKCGKDIIEGAGGHYVTGCEHYPMNCISCNGKATDMHHLIITRSMARGVSKSNKEFWKIVESDRNKYPLCSGCHLNYGGTMGHISRADGLKLLSVRYGFRASEIFESVLRDAEQYTKVRFARVV